MAPRGLLSARVAVEDVAFEFLGRFAPTSRPARRLLKRSIERTDVRAARSLAKTAAALATADIAEDAPALVRALRLRPLHKLNTLLLQVARGTGPDPDRLEPLRRGSGAWLQAAERRSLEGFTFVLGDGGDRLRRFAEAESSSGASDRRRLAEALAAHSEEVVPRWKAWQVEMASALLEGGPSVVHAADSRGRSAMHYAAAAGNQSLLKLLLESGADPLAVDDLNRTAAHVAALHSQTEALLALQEACGDRVNGAQDLLGFTPSGLMAARTAVLDVRAPDRSEARLPAAEGWRSLGAEETAQRLGLPAAPRSSTCKSASLAVADVRFWGGKARSLLAEAMMLQRPLLLRGAARSLPAAETWTKEGVISRFGDMPLRPTAWWPWGMEEGQKRPTLGNFVEQMASSREEVTASHSRAYAFDTPSGSIAEQLMADVPLFPSGSKGLVVRRPQLAVGAAGAGAPAHAHASALNALVVGVKRWLLVPPSDVSWSLTPPLLTGEAFANCIEVDQCEGDILYVPEHWGHSTVLLTDCVAAAYEFIPSSSLWS